MSDSGMATVIEESIVTSESIEVSDVASNNIQLTSSSTTPRTYSVDSFQEYEDDKTSQADIDQDGRYKPANDRAYKLESTNTKPARPRIMTKTSTHTNRKAWGSPKKPFAKAKAWNSPVKPKNKVWSTSPKKMEFPRVRSDSEPTTPASAFVLDDNDVQSANSAPSAIQTQIDTQVSQISTESVTKTLIKSRFDSPRKQSRPSSPLKNSFPADDVEVFVPSDNKPPWGYQGQWPPVSSSKIEEQDTVSNDLSNLDIGEGSSLTHLQQQHSEESFRKGDVVSHGLHSGALQQTSITLNSSAREKRRNNRAKAQSQPAPRSPVIQLTIQDTTNVAERIVHLQALLNETPLKPKKELRILSELLIAFTQHHGHSKTNDHVSMFLKLSQYWQRQGDLQEAIKSAQSAKEIVVAMMDNISRKPNKDVRTKLQQLCKLEANVDAIIAKLIEKRVNNQVEDDLK